MKGLLKKKNNDDVFKHLDVLFDIPKAKVKSQKNQEELINEFEKYVKGE